MQKTTLKIEVTYDECYTDPEALAAAFDKLLKTSMSIPWVFDEYGPVRVGEFLVSEDG